MTTGQIFSIIIVSTIIVVLTIIPIIGFMLCEVYNRFFKNVKFIKFYVDNKYVTSSIVGILFICTIFIITGSIGAW